MFNQRLNAMVQPDRRWTYKHTKTYDSFVMRGSQKLRATRDAAKEKVIEAMYKIRIADLAIHMPNKPLDVRISVNLETPVTLTEAELAILQAENYDIERFKDRRSYLDNAMGIQYDLTTVSQTTRGNAETKLELELESKRTADLLADPSNFVNELRGFLKKVIG